MERKEQIAGWLKKLEQESWQLELLVSGFTIFLLISAYQGLATYAYDFKFHSSNEGVLYIAIILLMYVVTACILVLIINLVLHLTFRGFWIGAIGLRSVGPAIDYDKLHYHPYFIDKLKKGMVSMDDLIVRLDRLCSVIFSFTFLIIFLFLSFFLFLVAFSLASWGINSLIELSPHWLAYGLEGVYVVVTLAFLLGGLSYMLDSLSLGILKKAGWLRRIYYPVYRFFSTITLSILYRSIYYNLITKFSKGAIRLILLAYLIVIFFIPFFELDDYRYFPDNTTPQSMDSDYYDDRRTANSFIIAASIPSIKVSDAFIPLFVRYDVSDNPALLLHCPDFEPEKKGGIKHGLRFSGGNLILTKPNVEETHPQKALECLLDFYELSVDHEPVIPEKAYFYQHPNREEKGLLIFIRVENLTKGPHAIAIDRQVLQDSVLKKEEYANIPFWYQ